ncbi:uncharacterized protein MYCFIDRAFT_84470 [Pseudocercospora fijiensis CIRAD86]|uniref:Uncharacterized protein n=1 Tax=Pseudocercospora fijiensis (strain CIRAD86) TaxID=383855 RepID=M2Z957_PSEFD|nr:uncharacterized protein MYCFIDRAFT_84470 [Pseudocercospora fijiensis CIRAD86]EME86320.1 hypothetical protein MYCFIDRAFT_84470 [Pseudocercospora fijiensis CIRAD86]
MADSAVVRGEFIYRDVLLVDVGGEGKRHARAAPSEIRDLLSGKAKDQVGHFYEAQLIHYGLQRSKVKDTAKVRLQQALSQGKLKAQPAHLADMESSMKKEYAAALRRASKADSGKGTKRAREDDVESSAKKTKVSVRVGDISIDIDQAGATSSKKQKTTPAKVEAPKQLTKTPATKASQAKSAVATMTPHAGVQKTPSAGRTKQTARKSAPWSGPSYQEFPDGPRQDPRNDPENVFQRSSGGTPKTSATTKKEANVKKEPHIKREPTGPRSTPSIRRASPIKHEGYLFDPDAMDTRADISERQLNITGVYTISCPQVAEQLPEEADNFRLFICVDNESGITWGGFEIAMKSGNIKMDDIDFARSVSFGWRARDSWEGGLRFGKGCFGEIAFEGNGNVRGTFHGLFNESMEFTGRRRTGPLWAGKSAYKFKQEWDAFPKEAYGD